MADTILFNLASQIFYQLGSAAVQEIGFLWGIKDEIRKLKNTVSTIRAVLLDAEDRKLKNHEVKDWLSKLHDAFYDADDLLEEMSNEVLLRRLMTQNKRAKQVRVFFSRSNQLAYSIRISQKIKGLRVCLDEIAEDRKRFHFAEAPFDLQVSKTRLREETHSFVRAEEAVGRENDKRVIEKLLLESDSEENVSVVPIVGIGGVGKTTLAQLVYNDEKVKKHFDLRVWVCVSDVFDVKIIAEKIIESITNKKVESFQFDNVQEQLRSKIDGKKYFLVLDDVWNENRESWLKLRDLLIGGARGSKILVTTRSGVVATITGTVQQYNLQGLKEGMSWYLFQKMAFNPGKEVSPGFMVIGKEIVRKCAGVPLAIRTLGSFLYYKDTEAEWLSIKNYQLAEMSENIEILPILKLSYDNLPTNLKQCFAYCSLFQKDQDIDRKMLVQLWIAQEFVKSMDHESQCLEDVGDQYFMDLLRRSFFQDIKLDRLGNVKSCRMHDLIHDLARLVARSDFFMGLLDTKDITGSLRHYSVDITSSSLSDLPLHLLKAKKLRTFLMPVKSHDYPRHSKLSLDSIVIGFKHLRVLDLHGLGIEDVPCSIGKLRSLRYVDMSENNLVSLPKDVTDLQNLQTLKLSYCYDLEELPRDICKMASLRHLELDGCTNLMHMPGGIGQLTSLKTLSQFVVVQGGSSFPSRAGLSELNGLTKLEGELTIRLKGSTGCCNMEPRGTTVKLGENLQSLRLEWDKEPNGGQSSEQLLDGVQPHSNLKKLFVERYQGTKFPKWLMINISCTLGNLVKVTLKNCDKCRYVPPFGQLPSVQVLKIESLTSLEYIDFSTSDEYQLSYLSGEGRRGSASYFPSLSELKLYNLPNLQGWWREEVASDHSMFRLLLLPLLSKLIIKDCPKLSFLPHLVSLDRAELIRVSEKLIKQQFTLTRTLATTAADGRACPPLSKLTSLYILDIEDLSTTPEGLQNLSQLEHLEINCCPKLTSISGGMRAMTALQFLQIHGCGLTSLLPAVQHLTALKTLVISSCNELDLAGTIVKEHTELDGLKSLASLQIIDIPKLVYLPEWLQHVTSLECLSIKKCYNLLALPEWIGTMNLLQRLILYKCTRLKSLPENMRLLTSMKELKILMCPRLYKRCRNENTEDWPKIAHIPKVIVK